MIDFFNKLSFYQKTRLMFAALALTHVCYLLLFVVIGRPILACMNTLSITVYLFFAVKSHKLEDVARGFLATRIEAFIHAFICAYVLGWDYGFQIILLAFMPIVFFSTFFSKTTNNLFIFMHGAAYMFLYFTAQTTPINQIEADTIYIINFSVAALFMIVLGMDFMKAFSAAIHQDILEKQEILDELANKDPLTELLNRNAFFSKVASRLPFLEQNVSIVLCDIDNFKSINDTYGHGFGDEVLKRMAHILNDGLRIKDYVFRWGGEEFLIVLTGINLSNSKQILERIRKRINATEFKCEDKVLKITMTFGFVNAKTDERIDIKEVIKQADEMLYKGKKSGKNTVVSANIPVTPPRRKIVGFE